MSDPVVIIGGGITGLAAAFYLTRAARERGQHVEFVLLEKEGRLGGTILTEKVSGYTIEAGPDCFLSEKIGVLDLCKDLGIEGRLLRTNDDRKGTYVLWKGRLHELPEGVVLMVPTRFMPFVTSSLISLLGKVRMGMEFFVRRPAEDSDESLGDFILRRFGSEALVKIGEPLVAGVHAGDPMTMSMRATFPRFLEMERKYGSLIRAMLSARRAMKRRPPQQGSGPTLFMALRDGLGEMVRTLARSLPEGCIRTGSAVSSVKKTPAGYEVALTGGGRLRASAVILAAPAHAASGMIAGPAPSLSDLLDRIPYVSTATVSLGYRTQDVPHPLNGYGFVVPRTEGRGIMACTWTSSKFSFRAPEGRVLLRFFVGGAFGERFLDQDDESLVALVKNEARSILGITAEPEVMRLYRWDRAMPQFVVGHLDRLKEIETEAGRLPGLILAGSGYRGTGIPDHILEGKRAALSALDYLRTAPSSPA